MAYLSKLKLFFVTVIIFVLTTICFAQETEEPGLGLGDISDGSGSIYIHKIGLHDNDDFVIFPESVFDQPFSTSHTCGRCHNFDIISGGWHFNANDPEVDPGRIGEPWLYWDCSTATQLPLSYRNWPGTYKPDQMNISDWEFVRTFGRHLPGGAMGMPPKSTQPNPQDPWKVSGNLEINCLSCHNADPLHDQAAFAEQITKHNFKWAATASCGFAIVEGTASTMPYYWLESNDTPKVEYDKSKFFPKKMVQMNLKRRVPNERCYFCHSSKIVGSQEKSQDVHLAAGLKCVDCHRNTIDHEITRGYEGHMESSENDLAVASSCKSCHIPQEDDKFSAGRLGAPQPEHAGIPTVHFDKLSCTACHSGPMPRIDTYNIKTSRAHALGTYDVKRDDDILPHIQAPVFAVQEDGIIAPHNLIWPAFWARLKDDKITPINVQDVEKAAGRILYLDSELESLSWPEMTEDVITAVLTKLASGEGQPVYISGSNIHRIVEGRLTTEKHEAAEPYMWPIAHDVRPALQSLGANGCEDCHSLDSAFIAGNVSIDSPLEAERGTISMLVYQGVNPMYARAFAFSFVFRPWMKKTVLAACGLIVLVLLVYLLKAIAYISRAAAGSKS